MKTFIVGSLLILLAGCSAKIDGGVIPDIDFGNDGQKINGPALDGVWQSGCFDGGWDGYRRTMKLTYAASAIQRTIDIYSDSQCTIKVNSETFTGSFRYVDSHGENIYEIEYSFYDAGVTTFINENIKRDGSTLMTSFYTSGSGVSPSISLALQQ